MLVVSPNTIKKEQAGVEDAAVGTENAAWEPWVGKARLEAVLVGLQHPGLHTVLCTERVGKYYLPRE